MSYDQMMFSIGYRFDRRRGRGKNETPSKHTDNFQLLLALAQSVLASNEGGASPDSKG